ncbi:MAG: methyltransferase domain-containing protein [Chloroflexales bacterium]|nr:methyltransferase domain-containing protein [Chloroflexales bacterium]
MHYFILTTRGLEDLAYDELQQQISTVRVRELAYRRVALAADASSAPALLGLRCTDDAFIEVADWSQVGKFASTLERLASLAATVDLAPALALCAELRPIAQPIRFAVSASFVGRRNYTTPQIKQALASGVRQHYGWFYTDEEAPDALSLRLFIEHERALLGVRLGSHPLHRRPYKTQSVPGSLRAPVAAAMLRLAGVTAGTAMLDPLCGAGTIVIEAALLGAHSQGGDNDATALAAARANLAASGARATLQQWDARALPLETASVDCVATNVPFGRQVLTAAELNALYTDCIAEIGRVLRTGGPAVLLSNQVDRLGAAIAHQSTLTIVAQREISLYGQTPQIWVLKRSRK